jgi:hypothetical protein
MRERSSGVLNSKGVENLVRPGMRPLIGAWQGDGPAGAIEGAASRGEELDAGRALVIGTFAVVSAAYFYATISRALGDHLWMDEVLAITAARQPTLSGVWQAILSGTDFSPPTYHFLLHGFITALGAEQYRLLWRLPSILALYGAACCIFLLLLGFRLGRAAAVLGFAMVLASGLFEYAIQVRQYALLALGLAAALLIWSGIGETRPAKVRACCLWLVLSACLCLHFYGFVQVAAIGTAELAYAISHRRVRVAVWSALLLTVPVEIALYPLASHLATFNDADNLAPGYYAKPTLDAFLRAGRNIIVGGAFGVPLLLAAVLMIVAGQLRRRFDPPATRSTPPGAGLSRLEMMMIALCALPFTTFAFSLFVTKSFSSRYMASAALLPAILIPYMLDRLPWRRTASLALVALVMAVLYMRAQPAIGGIADTLAVLQKAKPPLPIVVGEGLLYIELMEAAEPSLRPRLVYLTRPAGSFSPDPSNENAVVRLAGLRPEFQVSDVNAFLSAHRSFYVVTRPRLSIDTTTPLLAERGLLEGPLVVEDYIQLFRSRAPAPLQPGGVVP